MSSGDSLVTAVVLEKRMLHLISAVLLHSEAVVDTEIRLTDNNKRQVNVEYADSNITQLVRHSYLSTFSVHRDLCMTLGKRRVFI